MLQAAKYIGSGLATIGLTKRLLLPLLSPQLLCPSVISSEAEKAIIVVDEMLQSLPQDSLVLQHITEVALGAQVSISAQVTGDLVIPTSQIEFPEGNIPSGIPTGAGVYAFTELSPSKGQAGVQQAFGSTVGFPHRLKVHKSQFAGTSMPTNLHLHGNTIGGMSAFSWGIIYTLPNYLTSFYTSFPGYSLSQGEYDILMAVSQLIPRILEQSLFEHFASTLTGDDRLVLFHYVEYFVGSLMMPLFLGDTAKLVHIIADGVIIQTANSIAELVRILGVKSRRTIGKYINHIVPIYSPLLGTVNIVVDGYDQPLITDPIIHRKGSEESLPMLSMQGFDPTSLPLGPVFALDSDFNYYNGEGLSSVAQAAKLLNPSSPNTRGMAQKISRHMNLNRSVLTELGYFYFIENPDNNRFLGVQQGIYACDLYDLELGTCVHFDGLKPIVRYLAWYECSGKTPLSRTQKVTYDRLKTCYSNSTSFDDARILLKRFKIVPSK